MLRSMHGAGAPYDWRNRHFEAALGPTPGLIQTRREGCDRGAGGNRSWRGAAAASVQR